jgi:oligopeptide transport system substrate-binding protein
VRLRNAFLISILCVGCSCKAPVPGKKDGAKQKISINIETEPRTLDPRKVRSLGDINLVQSLMDGLMRVGKNGTTTLAIAEKYSVSEDMKTYLFNLKDTKWSNGDSVKASDFIYAWKKALSPEFNSDYAFLLYSIKNGKAIKQGLLPTSMLAASSKDDYTLEVTLENPTPFFLEILTLPIFFPVNQAIEKENGDWARNADSFVCNGPFKIGDWKHNDMITCIKNPLYWDADAVHLNSIQMVMVSAETGLNMFQNKELDWSGSPYSSIPTDAIPSLKSQNMIKSDPLLGTYWIRTNTEAGPLKNQNLRKALAVAINRNEIVSHITHSYEPATGIVPTSMGLQQVPYFTDGHVEEARDLLRHAIEEDDLVLEDFPDLVLTYAADTKNHRIAQAIQDQWQKTLGITVKLEAVEGTTCLEKVSKGNYQLAVGSWLADFRDPINFLEIFKTKSIGTNNTNWESLHYQKALEATYMAKSKEERMDELKKSEKILMSEMPILPIFHYTMLHVNNDKLKDVVLTDSGHIDFKWAYVEK